MSVSRISQELRQRVYEFSQFRCSYCQTSQSIIGPYLEIDHIRPEAHGGASDENNLIAACSHCNNRKGARLSAIDPQTQRQIRLFHPRLDHWHEHFEWTTEGTVIRGKTAIGRAPLPRWT